MIAVHDRARVAVLAWEGRTQSVNIEEAAAVARIHRLRVQFVADAPVQCQPG